MKRSYDIYRPGHLIRDVTAVPEYYQADDVKVSPFTTVGELSEAPEGTSTDTFDAKPVEPAKPVFTTDLRGRLRRPPAVKKPAGKPVPIAAASDSISAEETAILTAAPFSQPAWHGRTIARMRQYRTGLVTAATAWLVAASRFINRQEWLPHKYLWSRGWVIDRRETIREAGFLATPLAVLLILVLVAAFTRPSPAPNGPSGHNGGSAKQTYTTGSNKLDNPPPTQQPPQGGSTTASSGVGTPTVPAAGSTGGTAGSSGGQVASYPSTTYGPGSGSTTGGRGGDTASGSGSTPTTTSGGSTGTNIPGVTTPLPIVIPGQSVQSGGKQIIGTDPVGVTLN